MTRLPRQHRTALTSTPPKPDLVPSGRREPSVVAEQYLTVRQVAALLNTTERFPRRLIEERRIAYVRIGRHIRIPESALRAFIEAGRVEPLRRARTGRVA